MHRDTPKTSKGQGSGHDHVACANAAHSLVPHEAHSLLGFPRGRERSRSPGERPVFSRDVTYLRRCNEGALSHAREHRARFAVVAGRAGAIRHVINPSDSILGGNMKANGSSCAACDYAARVHAGNDSNRGREGKQVDDGELSTARTSVASRESPTRAAQSQFQPAVTKLEPKATIIDVVGARMTQPRSHMS